MALSINNETTHPQCINRENNTGNVLQIKAYVCTHVKQDIVFRPLTVKYHLFAPLCTCPPTPAGEVDTALSFLFFWMQGTQGTPYTTLSYYAGRHALCGVLWNNF